MAWLAEREAKYEAETALFERAEYCDESDDERTADADDAELDCNSGGVQTGSQVEAERGKAYGSGSVRVVFRRGLGSKRRRRGVRRVSGARGGLADLGSVGTG